MEVSEQRTGLIQFYLQKQALHFGDFTLKSGRKSPYFFNAGVFYDGVSLLRLGRAYAAILKKSVDVSAITLFGPAYKGIVLATATAMALAEDGIQVPLCFNRKEIKDHGEGGQLIGALQGKVILIDDVLTAGTALKEAIQLIKAAGAQPVGAVLLLDREERVDEAGRSAVQQLKEEHHLFIEALVGFKDILQFVEKDPQYTSFLSALQNYRANYGALS